MDGFVKSSPFKPRQTFSGSIDELRIFHSDRSQDLREKFEKRIQKVAMSELGIRDITHEEHPLAMRQLFAKGRDVRGHFISLLFLCKLESPPTTSQWIEGEPEAGQWCWHKGAPQNLLTNQLAFIKYINETKPL